jgi:hypothetical protein
MINMLFNVSAKKSQYKNLAIVAINSITSRGISDDPWLKKDASRFRHAKIKPWIKLNIAFPAS